MERSETEKTGKNGGSSREFLCQKQLCAFPSKRSHSFTIVPLQVVFELPVQILYAREGFPVIEISLIVPMTSIYFAIVPRRSGRYQLMGYFQYLKRSIERAYYIIAEKSIGEFCSVICLYCLSFKRKRLDQHF